MKASLQTNLKIIFQAMLLAALNLWTLSASAQTEDFEGEPLSGTTFTVDGVQFNLTGDFLIHEFENFSCGGSNSGVNRYMSTGFQDGGSSGVLGSIVPENACVTFRLDTGQDAQWGWTGTMDGDNETNGTIRFTGVKPDQTTVAEDISFAPSNFTALVSFTFSNSIWGGVDLVSLQMEIVNSPSCDYFAMDELVFGNISGQHIIFTEDFEDHGNSANGGSGRYTSANDFFVSIDGNGNISQNDYWGRVQASDNQYFLTNSGSGFFIHSNIDYTGQHGNFFYAGEDQDALGSSAIGTPDEVDEKEIVFTNINITGGTNLRFSGLFARGENNACGASRYDASDFIKIFYKIDGGTEVEAMCFNADLECNGAMDTTNEPLHHDPDCNGDGGEGMALTAEFRPFTFDIAGTGTALDLRIQVHMDAGDEEIAFDFFQICSDTEVQECTVTAGFSAPANLCEDAGVQAGLGGGTPTGGVYSGPGVTDDGNGMSYSFNPAAAGAGEHTITYTYNEGNNCPDAAASDDIMVFASPSVTFAAPPDLCISTGIQSGLGGGVPSGGMYSGPGVVDNGNGTYNFDPSTAGVGLHTITYNFIDANGCSGSASDAVEVFALPGVIFVAPADLCVSEGVQTGLGGGMPVGGVYSGPGVTDDGNGMTYSFDPAAAGVGAYTISYTYSDINSCESTASDDLEVFSEPDVLFSAPADLCANAGLQTGLGGGSPTGGVYSGPGVTDDGNGMTYSFDPAVAGVGTHSISYEYSSGANCSGSASDVVEVLGLPAVTLTLPDTFFVIDGVLPTGIGGGSPAGGVYTDMYGEIDDDGNGMTFSFNSSIEIGLNNFITYTYTDANGCQNSATVEVWVVDGTVNVVDLAALGGNVFPNPTTGVIHLVGLQAKKIGIFDSFGKLVQLVEGSPSRIDLSAFQAGIYTLLINLGEGQFSSAKVVKF